MFLIIYKLNMEKLIVNGGTKKEKSFDIVGKIDENHFIVKGVMWQHVVDSKGLVVSEGYRKVEIEAGILFGQKGAIKYILDGITFQETGKKHCCFEEEGGVVCGVTGPWETILDPLTSRQTWSSKRS